MIFFSNTREILRIFTVIAIELVLQTSKLIKNMKQLDFSNCKIYHLLVDRFCNPEHPLPVGSLKNDFLGGNLEGVISKLPYIKGLGFNAVMLSPVMKGNAYHGYHTTDYQEIDEHFGTWDDLDNLVNEAHKLEISVIIDCVLNHCHYTNPLFQHVVSSNNGMMRDWFHFKNRKDSEYISYMNLPDLPKFNLENADAATYMIEKVEMLVETGIDGIRLDHAIGLPFGFLKQLSKSLHRKNPDLKIIGEVWAGGCTREVMSQFYFKTEGKADEYLKNGIDQEELQKDYIGALDGVLDFRFRDILIDEIREGHRIRGNKMLRRKLIDHFRNYPREFQLVLFMDNHDTDRILYECGQDKTLMMEILEEIQSLCRPFSIYYGTECMMTNFESVNDGTPYADLRVRTPMDWSQEAYNILNIENERLKTIEQMNTTDDDRKRNSPHPQDSESPKWIPTTPHWKLQDIIASEDLKSKLKEISSFMMNIETMKAWGLTRFRPNGTSYVMNFWGPPGTGKSISVEALANECRMKVIRVSYSELQSSKWGGTEKNLTSLFECAKNNNALVIFNEADYLFSSRKDGPNSEVNNMIKAHLINLLDSYEVFIALTTNRFFDYDGDAFYRRTLFQVNVSLPGKAELMSLAKFHLGCEETGFCEGGTIPKAENFSFEQASETLAGLSGGDIACIATNCMVKVIVSSNRKLTNLMLKDVVDYYHINKTSAKTLSGREVVGKEKEEVMRVINNQ